MHKDDSPRRDRENRASPSAMREARASAWSPRSGTSGYGMESIRPHLMAQLERQKLLHPTFPPEPPQRGEDERDADQFNA
jgi:hypothetical protein